MAKILATALYPQWTKHFVAELSFLEEHLEEGDEIVLLACDAHLRACSCNPDGTLSGCLLCMGARDDGLRLLTSQPSLLPLVSDKIRQSDAPEHLAFFSGTLENLQALKVDNFDIGYAAFSPLVDVARTYLPDVRLHRELTRSLLVDAWRTYVSALETLESGRFDRVYIFNGRFAVARAWLRACQKLEVPFVTHDRARVPTRVHRHENTIPHDLRQRAARIEAFWEEYEGDEDIVAKGHQFFTERINVTAGQGNKFVSAQEPGRLPDGFDSDGQSIAFFPTTEGEFAGIRDLSRKGLFDSQVQAYAWIAAAVTERLPDVRIYMRIHPNSAKEKSEWWDSPAYKALPNLTVIPPESAVSSYALMKAASKVVVFRSTMGVESAYWGKPSMILCPAGYSKINAVYEPQTPEEAVDMLVSDLEPKPQINAVKFGAFMMCAGTPLRYAGLSAEGRMTFKGKVIEAPAEVRELAHQWWGHKQRLPKWLFPLLSRYLHASGLKRYKEIRRELDSSPHS